jgi:hypothetical protein
VDGGTQIIVFCVAADALIDEFEARMDYPIGIAPSILPRECFFGDFQDLARLLGIRMVGPEEPFTVCNQVFEYLSCSLGSAGS